MSALMLACKAHNIETVREILKQKDLLINKTNNLGQTALILATKLRKRKVKVEIVKQILTNNDCDISLADVSNKTAMDYSSGHKKILELLKDAEMIPMVRSCSTLEIFFYITGNSPFLCHPIRLF